MQMMSSTGNKRTKKTSMLKTPSFKRGVLTVSALLSTAALIGCGHHHSGGGTSDTTTGLAIASGNSIAVFPATAAQCAAGGSVYAVYFDSNRNGMLDGTDSVVSTQAICNGASGAVGLTTVVGLNRVTVGSAICASGAGLQVSAGRDANANLILDASEISQSQIVCDGKTGAAGSNGATGLTGTAGSNGHGIVSKMLQADTVSCPTGGTTILMALDVSDSGIYSDRDPQQQSTTICNGTNGANGTNGTDGTNGTNGLNAQSPAYSAVDAIMPCGNTVSNKEVLLRLANGDLLASVSDSANGFNTRFSFMVDGNYTDTDGSSCNFSVSTSADGTTRSISWLGQLQSTWPISH